MASSSIQFNDLPDEILIIIFSKLNNLDVLYSFQGVNQRLNRLIQDQIFTNRLTFVKWLSDKFLNLICCNMIYNRFCLQILPEIHHNIKWLDLESSSMKYVLRIARYPNLHSLGLYNIHEESFQCLLTDDILSSRIFKNQITTLLITIDNNKATYKTVVNIFDSILTVFTNLNNLMLYESSYKNRLRLCCYHSPSPTFRSSTLRKLSVRLQCINDCLYLLDHRFDQLHTLYVDLVNIDGSCRIQNREDLPNLKCFSLSSNVKSFSYYKTILPLLNRMFNLEELALYMVINIADGTFIDGNNLKRNIIDFKPRLNQFSFYIRSIMDIRNQMNLPTTADIQRTFIDFSDHEIISYVDYFPEAEQGRCHVYSYPSFMPYYGAISNNFPGGLFKYVSTVSLHDEEPFEHEFFLQIAQSFPRMEKLTLKIKKPQDLKHTDSSNDNAENLSIIEYPFLNELIIINVHDDYIEEFLLDTRTYLPKNIFLSIKYQSLERVTHHFKRDATRINCAKVNELELFPKTEYSNYLHEYFPYAQMYVI